MKTMTLYYLYLNNLLAEVKEHQEGQSLAEYGLILALIAVVCIAAVRVLGTTISGFLNTLATNMAS